MFQLLYGLLTIVCDVLFQVRMVPFIGVCAPLTMSTIHFLLYILVLLKSHKELLISPTLKLIVVLDQKFWARGLPELDGIGDDASGLTCIVTGPTRYNSIIFCQTISFTHPGSAIIL